MTYVLTNAHMVPVQVAAAATRKVPAEPGLLARFYAAMIDSRRESAERQLRARNLLINEAGIVLGGVPYATLSTDEQLPFNR
jgi:hypothetical protein